MNNKSASKFHFKDSNIEPLSKVSEQDIIDAEQTQNENCLLTNFQKIIEKDNQRSKKEQKKAMHQQHLETYISRKCHKFNASFCRSGSIENCTNCFMKNFHISFIKMENSIIYEIPQSPIKLITENDVLGFLKQISILPNEKNEIAAIFYLHRELLLEKRMPDTPLSIPSASPLYPFLYFAAQRILQKISLTKEIIAQDKNYNKMRNIIYAALSINDFNFKKSPMPPPKTLVSHYKKSLTDIETINKALFSKLRSTLFNISNGNTDILHNILLLIGKIYLGQNCLNLLKESSPLMTIIQCKNPKYIKDFITDFFPYSIGIKNHPLKSLQPNLIPQLIRDKLDIALVNIDSSESVCSDLSFLKKLVSNTTVSIDDPLFSKVCYKSTTHYLYITSKDNNDIQRMISSVASCNLISINGNIAQSIYEPLDVYESIFLAITAIYYTIDTYTNDNNLNSLSKDDVVKKPVSEDNLIEKFLSNFCIDRTKEINEEALSHLDQNSLKTAKVHTDIIKKLGIDALPHAIKDDLYYAFNLWYKSTYDKLSSLSETEFNNNLMKKYHKIFYRRFTSTSIYHNTKKEYYNFHGLSIKSDELDSYVKEQALNKRHSSEEELKETFSTYLESLINKYEPILFGLYSNNQI